MAIGAANKTSGAVAADTSATTASVTPTAYALQLLLVNFLQVDGVVNSVTNNNGGTWDLVDEFDNFDIGGIGFAYLFRSLIAAPVAGTAVINAGGASGGAFSYSWMEFTGVDLTGTNGAGAIGQHLKATAQTSGTATKTLAALQSGSASYGGICLAQNNVITPGAGYTVASQNGATAGRAASEYQLAGSTTVNGTFTITDWALFALEIKALTDFLYPKVIWE